ncbi:uncharacterized protein RCC_08721 [Ramularia collo-cygni]|uniref:Uncharacterized protein n=1 Tax=Ramularia collo-cygni TaxID=112498 RepID=A0A2D3VFU2_9PEZI|nr:uncharacterized protein RCC_08721 [Ramularia collo-cygni]CZT23011.1 uncharacterized protein RCC_08721 [Ramularia collo-cygni]
MSAQMDELPTELLWSICDNLELTYLDVRLFQVSAFEDFEKNTSQDPSIVSVVALAAVSKTCSSLRMAALPFIQAMKKNTIVRLDMRNCNEPRFTMDKPHGVTVSDDLFKQFSHLEVIVPCMFTQHREREHDQTKNLTMKFGRVEGGRWVMSSLVWETVLPPAIFNYGLVRLAFATDVITEIAMELADETLNTTMDDLGLPSKLECLWEDLTILPDHLRHQTFGHRSDGTRIRPRQARPFSMMPIAEAVEECSEHLGETKPLERKAHKKLGWRGTDWKKNVPLRK